jgi:PadR family transcriptional regulator, regulatory protein PadR
MGSSVIQFLLGDDGCEAIPSLSPKEATILRLLLASRKEMYGLQIVAESEGAIGRGTVYVTLSRMEDKGFVESKQETPPEGATGLPRRLYRVTGEGSRVLRAWERAARVLRGAKVAT